jgi:hypothetical protein
MWRRHSHGVAAGLPARLRRSPVARRWLDTAKETSLRTQSIQRIVTRLATAGVLTGMLVGVIAGAAQAGPALSAPAADHTGATAIKPQVAVIVDGKRYTPREFARIAPSIKYFTVPADGKAGDVMYGYTDKASYDRETARMDREAVSVRAQRSAAAWDTVTYYEGIYWGGPDQFSLGAYQSISDLTKHWAHCWPICSANWNDRISSLNTGAYNTKLFEHADFGGAQISFGTYRNVSDLGVYGWNDVASSVTVVV